MSGVGRRLVLLDPLLQVPEMQNPGLRDLVVDLLRQTLADAGRTLSVNRDRFNERVDTLRILMACQSVHGGLRTLMEVLQVLNPDDPGTKAFVAHCEIHLSTARFLLPEERAELQDLLDRSPTSVDIVALYMAAMDPADPAGLDHADDLNVVVNALESQISPDPLFAFVERFAAAVRDRDSDVVARLHAWSDRYATRAGASVRDLLALRQSLASPPGSGPAPRDHLLIRIDPHTLSRDRFAATAWLSRAGGTAVQVHHLPGPAALDEVAIDAGRLIQAHLPRTTENPLALIEFILPGRLLDWPAEERVRDAEGTAVGRTYPVVVRMLERPGLAGADVAEHWRTKWRWLLDNGGVYQQAVIQWVDDCERPPDQDDGHVCLALACPPPREADRWAELLRFGAPVALWHRDPRDEVARRSALAGILNGRALTSLPDIVLKQRRAAAESGAVGTHPGRGVVLLWDDPHRLPADTILALTGDQESGS